MALEFETVLQNAKENKPVCWFDPKNKDILGQKPVFDHLTGKEIDILGVMFIITFNKETIVLVFDCDNEKGIKTARALQAFLKQPVEDGMEILPFNIQNTTNLELWIPEPYQYTKGNFENNFQNDNFTISDKTKYADKSIEALQLMTGKEPLKPQIEQKYSNPLELLNNKVWKPVKRGKKDDIK